MRKLPQRFLRHSAVWWSFEMPNMSVHKRKWRRHYGRVEAAARNRRNRSWKTILIRLDKPDAILIDMVDWIRARPSEVIMRFATDQHAWDNGMFNNFAEKIAAVGARRGLIIVAVEFAPEIDDDTLVWFKLRFT
jgi:hypothetical protein